MASKSTMMACKLLIASMDSEQFSEIQQYVREQERQISTISAKVFSTPELLELIMLSLSDTTDIFVSMRVNRMFRDTVQHSVRLRRATFVTYDAEPSFTNAGAPIVNPGLPFFMSKLGYGFQLYYFDDEDPPRIVLHLNRMANHATLENIEDVAKLEDKIKTGTWRLTKITKFQIKTAVSFFVHGGRNVVQKHTTFDLDNLEGPTATMGTLWDLGQCIRMRSLSDHRLMCHRSA